MSTAFRNFIITFALAAVLFAVVSYMAVNGILEGLFSGIDSGSEDLTEYSYENAESYYDGEYDGSEEVIPSTDEFGNSYVVFYEDHNNELINAKFLCVNEETGKLVFETIPVESSLTVNGYTRSVKEVYASNGEKYLCGKLQYVLGVNVRGYVVLDTESMNRFFTETTICKDNEIEITCNLPYEVKYEDPEMKEYNEQNPDDIQYVTLAGEAVLTPENATAIFTEIPEDSYDSAAASEMFGQIYDNVFKSMFSNEKIRNSSDVVSDFFSCIEKNTIDKEEYIVLFGIYDGLHEVKSFPELASSSGRELNWANLPSILESIMK